MTHASSRPPCSATAGRRQDPAQRGRPRHRRRPPHARTGLIPARHARTSRDASAAAGSAEPASSRTRCSPFSQPSPGSRPATIRPLPRHGRQGSAPLRKAAGRCARPARHGHRPGLDRSDVEVNRHLRRIPSNRGGYLYSIDHVRHKVDARSRQPRPRPTPARRPRVRRVRVREPASRRGRVRTPSRSASRGRRRAVAVFAPRCCVARSRCAKLRSGLCPSAWRVPAG